MKTKTTLEFLDAVKAKYSLTSDYQLSKFLNIRHSSISRYRSGKGSFDDVTCLIIAEALGIEGGYVMMCIAAERAKDEKVKKAWEWTAQHLGGLAAALAVLAILPFTPDIMSAPSFMPEGAQVMGFGGFTETAGIYIMRISDSATWPLLAILAVLLFAALPRRQRRQ